MKPSKLPSGNWRVNLYLGKDTVTGKYVRKSITHRNKKECIKLALEYAEKHKSKPDCTSVLASLYEYIQVKEQTLSPATIRSYYGIVRDLEDIASGFCKMDIMDVRSRDIQLVIDTLKTEKKASPKTIRNKIGLISATFRYKNIVMPEVTFPQRERIIYHIPEKRLVKKMLQCAKDTDKELWICIMLAATGPLREGEISALSIDDIDFKKNIIHVRHSNAINKNNEWVQKAPKTYGSDRYIGMSEELLKTIKEQGYVTKWMPRQIYEHFKKLLKANKIPDCRFHDLRHFCVSELKAQGFSDVYIAARTGHTNLSTLQNIYTHVLQSHQKKVDKDIVKYFDKAFE